MKSRPARPTPAGGRSKSESPPSRAGHAIRRVTPTGSDQRSRMSAAQARAFVAAGGRPRRALVSRRRTLDSLLGGNTSKGSTYDAADDCPWRTTDDRVCHFARDGAHNGATKRSFAVRRRNIRLRELWACRCRLLGFRARDARTSVHDRSFGAVGWPRRHRAGRSRQWLGAVPAAGVWAACPSLPCAGEVSAASTTIRKRRSSFGAPVARCASLPAN